MTFIVGHKTNLGKKRPKELYPNFGMRGKKQPESQKRKVSEKLKGRPKSVEHRLKMSLAKKGKTSSVLGKHWKLSEEFCRKQSLNRKGHLVSNETRRKIGLANSISLKGRKVSDDARKKISQATIGEKHWNWQGGKSFEEYPINWTNTLKRSIRERDHYICQICNKQQEEEIFDVHHIDYDKKNCNPINLITLCRSCHMKTNVNREQWVNYFKTILWLP